MRISTLLLALSIISISSVNSTPILDEHISISRGVIEKYMQKSERECFMVYHFIHKKAYSLNSGEAKIRFKIFKKNLKFVKEHNAKNLTWKVGLNKFADLSDEEWEEYIDKEKADEEEKKSQESSGLKFLSNSSTVSLFDKLADKVDAKILKNDDDNDGCDDLVKIDYFEYLPPVSDQLACKYGNIFHSVVSSMTAQYNFQNNLTKENKIENLSAQQILDCGMYSCVWGIPKYTYDDIFKFKINLSYAKDYREWDGEKKTCDKDAPSQDLVVLKNNGYRGCEKLASDTRNTVKCNKDIYYNLLTQGPCVSGFDTYMDEIKFYQEGIIDLEAVNRTMCYSSKQWAVVYSWKHQKNVDSTIREYLGVRASFGKDFGENGDIRIYYNEKTETCKLTQNCYQADIE